MQCCFLYLFACITLSGCATIWPNHSQLVSINVPEGAMVYDTSGARLLIDSSNSHDHKLVLSSAKDNILFVKLDSTFFEVRPKKSIRFLTLLDVFPMCIGTFLDDLTGNALQFSEVSFDTTLLKSGHPPNGAGFDTVFLPRSREWEYPYFLLTADFGGFYRFDYLPQGISPRGEVGMGAGLARRVELIAEYELISAMGIPGDHAWQGSAITKSLKVRLYPYKGLYLSGGFGWLHATMEASTFTPANAILGSSDFHEILLGIGYSANIAFAEFEQSFAAPSQVTFGSQKLNYSFWVLKFGLNFRFP